MFLALKLLRVGAKQAKKHSAKTKSKNQNQGPWPEPHYYNPNHPYYNHANNFSNPNPTGGPGGRTMPFASAFHTQPPPPVTEPYIPSQGEKPPPSKTAKMKSHLENFLRLIQFALGLAVIGLYGQDIKPSESKPDSRWVYAVVVGFLGSITTFTYLVLNLLVMKSRPLRERLGVRLPVFVWEAVVVVNWLVVFGIFAKLWLGNGHLDGGEEKDGKEQRMRRAVYVDLVGLVLWGGSAAWMGIRWWRGRLAPRGGDEEGEKGAEM